MTEPQSPAADLLPLTQPQAQPAAPGSPGAGSMPSGAGGAAENGDEAGGPAFAEVLAARLAGAAATTAPGPDPLANADSGVTTPAAGGSGEPPEAADAEGTEAAADGTSTAPAGATTAAQATLVAVQAVAAAPAGQPVASAHGSAPEEMEEGARGAGEAAGGTGTAGRYLARAGLPAQGGGAGAPLPAPAPSGGEAPPAGPDALAAAEGVRHAARKGGGQADAPAPAAVRGADLPTHPPQPPHALRPTADTAPAQQAERAPLDTATPDWPDALGERVVWMAGRGSSQHATLRLNPPHLGSVEVRLTVSPQDGQASVSFHVQHPDAREAIQAALPRLREMMAEAGMQLADAQVSHREPHDSGAGEQRHGRDRAPGGDAPVAEATAAAAPAAPLARAGLLDLYA